MEGKCDYIFALLLEHLIFCEESKGLFFFVYLQQRNAWYFLQLFFEYIVESKGLIVIGTFYLNGELLSTLLNATGHKF